MIMKHLFKFILISALGAAMISSCKEKEGPAAQKPVVTADMYSVTANEQTGEVVFSFKGEGLSPYWTVTDPNGVKATFTDMNVTKTYEVNGLYTGSIIAFGQSGQSDPVEFSFTISIPVNPTVSETEKLLMSTTWKCYHYGWCADAQADWWEYEESSVPSSSADDRLIFGKDGVFTLNLGDDKAIYNEQKDGIKSVTLTGSEKWAYVKEGDVEYIQFSGGGFPGWLGDDNGINGRYEIRNVAENRFSLYYDQTYNKQYIYFVFVPEDYVEPAVTEEQAKTAITGKTFYASSFGWWGEGWEYFGAAEALSDGDEITFKADGTLVLKLGDKNDIYNDGITGGEIWTVTGNEKWSVVSEGASVFVQFADGGFPLMLAGKHDDPELVHNGLNGKWTITSIDGEGTVRLDFEQPFSSQWFTVFLSPAE